MAKFSVSLKRIHLRAVFADDPSVEEMTKAQVLSTWDEVGEETCLLAMKRYLEGINALIVLENLEKSRRENE